MMTETKHLLASSAMPVHIAIESVGNSVRLGLSIPEHDLTDTLEAALAGPAGKQLSALAASIKNAQGSMMITGSQPASGNSSAVPTATGGSLISNIQGGELEPAHAATEPAAVVRKPQ